MSIISKGQKSPEKRQSVKDYWQERWATGLTESQLREKRNSLPQFVAIDVLGVVSEAGLDTEALVTPVTQSRNPQTLPSEPRVTSIAPTPPPLPPIIVPPPTKSATKRRKMFNTQNNAQLLMSFKEKIINFFSATLGVSLFIFGLFIILSIIKGLSWFSQTIYPYFLIFGSAVFWLSIFISLPLALIKKTRGIAGICFVLSSWFFGLLLLIQSVIDVYIVWGGVGVLIGLFLGVLTIIPEAFIAAIFHSNWTAFFNLMGFFAPTLVFFGIGTWLIIKDSEKDD